MKTAFTLLASGPSLLRISEMSNSVVGQTSGQCVKPKKTSDGRPLRSRSLIGLPFWSVRLNGPPIAALVLVLLFGWGRLTGPPLAALVLANDSGPRPVTIMTTAKQRTSPARNAERISSRRVVRGSMILIVRVGA